MHPMLNIASRTAQNAGDIIRRSASIGLPSSRPDQITFGNKISQTIHAQISQSITTAYPSHFANNSQYRWLISPLLGLENFLQGYPHCAVTIALQHLGETIIGVVYDPFRDELFSASRGGGARLNNYRIRVTQTHLLQSALLGMSVQNASHLPQLLQLGFDIRCSGVASLDLAYLAAGRLDGFYATKPADDLAPAVLLVEESGGIVSDFALETYQPQSTGLVAGNSKIHRALQQIVTPKR